MTSQVTDSGKHKCEEAVCNMESTKDDSPKSRFFVVWKEIYNRYKEKKQTENQTVSVVLKRGPILDTDRTSVGLFESKNEYRYMSVGVMRE